MRACAKALLRWMGVVPCTLNTWKECVDVLSVSCVLFLIRKHISGLVLPLHVYVYRFVIHDMFHLLYEMMVATLNASNSTIAQTC